MTIAGRSTVMIATRLRSSHLLALAAMAMTMAAAQAPVRDATPAIWNQGRKRGGAQWKQETQGRRK